LDANIVAETICKQIEARISYKRATKMAIASTMRMGAEGIKVRLGGRLAGAEIARREEYKEGRTPLHTFRADIDYAWKEAQTVYGKIGVKVWICRGEVFGKRDLTPNFAGAKEATGSAGGGGGNAPRQPRRDDNRGGGGRDRGGDRGGNRGGGGGGKR
jgi:small subunit ribosomal protein S3